MGIPRLNSLVSYNPALFQPISLHDTFLVIDGINISIWLYNDREFCQESVLNGDYSEYECCVSNFFAQLKQCNIFPVVILDGGHEERKLKKTRERMEERIIKNEEITDVNFGGRDVFYPAQITEVFKDVMLEMKIFSCQDLLEADLNILKTAQFLDCPVLSYDSDFYLEDVKYIPFSKLEWKQAHDLKRSEEASTSSSKHFLNAALFKRSKFHKRFGKLRNSSFLPLLSFLLGNDYSESAIYETFFRNLYRGINPNDLKQKIPRLSTWLRRFDSPEIAVEEFLEEIPPGSRERTRRELLRCLTEKNSREPSYLVQYIHHSLNSMAGIGAPPSELKEKIKTIEGSSEWLKKAATYVSPHEPDTNDQTAYRAPAKMSIPDWIITQHIAAKFPRTLIDLLHTQNFFYTLQMEQHFSPSGEETGSATDHTLTILQRVLGILYHGDPKKDDVSITVYSRVGNRLLSQNITPIFSNSSPILTEMPTLPLDEREKIAFDILEVEEVHKTEIPDSWKLFFLTLASWYRSDKSEIMTDALGCIIFSSIFVGIIDKKLGYHETVESLKDKYPEIWNKVNDEKQVQDGKSKSTKIMPSISAQNFQTLIDRVELEDCIVALKHFIKLRERNHSLSESESLFKPILHRFAQFQINIIMTEILNSVLHLPFTSVKIADFYYGTLAYNIYFEIKKEKHENLESFIKSEFKDMPTLQALFLSAIQVVETLSNCKLSQQRKRKSRFSSDAENIKIPKLA